MSEHQHTPGPWVATNRPTFSGHDFWTVHSLQSRDDVVYVTLRCNDQLEANARLIAAAPELLEALEGCLTCEFPVIDRDAVSKALAAIAKATGKESA